MNIFVLDLNPALAAEYHCDRHVPKMILESAQMLSTALQTGYKPTHKTHPCTLWVKESRQNAMWLISLATALNEEWRYRWQWKHNHKSYDLIQELAKDLSILPDEPMTPFAQAMPDRYKSNDAVQSYRQYYIYEKADIATWKYTQKPHWWW